MSSVRVVLSPFGIFTAPRCELDKFHSNDTVTVSSLESGRTIHEFRPGEWDSATAYDDDGNVLYFFISEELERRTRDAAEYFKHHKKAVA